MAALNWAMLSPGGRPVPLPGEKFVFSSTPAINVSLFPHPPGSPPSVQPTKDNEYKATGGTLYVSQRRVVFVAPGARAGGAAVGAGSSAAGTGSTSSAPAAGSLASGQASIAPGGVPPSAAPSRPPLETLSVPLRYFVDGRLVQPWFTASYYEALCLEGNGSGGLHVSQTGHFVWPLSVRLTSPAGQTPHLVRLYFKEGGSYEFYSAVEEMRARAEMSGRTGTPVESLRALAISLLGTPVLQSADAKYLCNVTTAVYEARADTARSAVSSSAGPESETAPRGELPADDLVAAQTAAAAEEAERHVLDQQCAGRVVSAVPPAVGEGEAPPRYEA